MKQQLKQFVLLLVLQFVLATVNAQLCSQPGALVSIKNSYRSHMEYIVFTFADPYKAKGDLHKVNKTAIALSAIKGEQFYSITFNNASTACETRNYCVVPQRKVKDVKLLQKADGTISYVIGLDQNAKITSHIAYDIHNFHIVKIRVE